MIEQKITVFDVIVDEEAAAGLWQFVMKGLVNDNDELLFRFFPHFIK
jgi:hypothetical protein